MTVGGLFDGGELVAARYHIGPGSAVDTVRMGRPEDQAVGRVTFEDGRTLYIVELPLGPRWLAAHGPGGVWATAISSRYLVTLHQPDGTVLEIAGPALPGPETAPAERDSAQADLDDELDRINRRDAGFRVPDRKPPLANLFFDREGRLWIEKTAAHGTETREADVYAGTTLIARYRWPSRVDSSPVPWVRGSELYGTTTDELGVERVVRVRFERLTDG